MEQGGRGRGGGTDNTEVHYAYELITKCDHDSNRFHNKKKRKRKMYGRDAQTNGRTNARKHGERRTSERTNKSLKQKNASVQVREKPIKRAKPLEPFYGSIQRRRRKTDANSHTPTLSCFALAKLLFQLLLYFPSVLPLSLSFVPPPNTTRKPTTETHTIRRTSISSTRRGSGKQTHTNAGPPFFSCVNSTKNGSSLSLSFPHFSPPFPLFSSDIYQHNKRN